MRSGSDDKMMKVWSATTGVLQFTLADHDDTHHTEFEFSPDGARLATSGLFRTVKVSDAASGVLKFSIYPDR